MKQLSDTAIRTIERAYDTKDECNADVEKMIKKKFEIVSDEHDFFLYYRKFSKVISEKDLNTKTHNFKGKVVRDEDNGSWWLVDEQGNERIAADLLTGIDFSFDFDTTVGDEIEVTVKRKFSVES